MMQAATDLAAMTRLVKEAPLTLVEAAPWAAPNVLGPGVEIEVAVLGPTEVRGISREFSRSAARELVVYLALHPRGACTQDWATALWPDRLMAPATLHSTASCARRVLGRSPSGHDHLPRSHGRLQLSRSVTTDWQRLCAMADSGEVAAHRSALELVRGRPFEGLANAEWTVFEGVAAVIEDRVVDLACSVADRYLKEGEPRAGAMAARRGLVASPYDERLHRRLLVCADQGGNPGGVERVMSDLVCLLEGTRRAAQRPFDLSAVHPQTAALYGRLTRRRRPETGPSASTN